ncbi:hypothetical protein PILCRDRAFT_17256 [Piloderma croceum F 1598]|uniref:Uncharacterized protein n=1 Tax=Piloderma croceum (strain F 1598) TaxID=765440 RepID=A0A0C3ABS4_PILCF|nr:hypothetical protein PILCRDRAFT_17256 [Piloderma croceum F 1598]
MNKESPDSEPRPSMRTTVSEEMEPQPSFDNSNPDIPEDNPTPETPETPDTLTTTPKIDITLVNADISAQASSTSDSTPVDLLSIPEEYHDFADLFDKAKADMLALHRPYDLKINLDEDATLPLGHMYSLSQTELVAL